MKILTLDIETSPIEAWVWHLFGDYVSLDKLKEPTMMLCYAAKFLGEKEKHFRTLKDPDFLDHLHALLNEADAVVTYNGDSFDIKHINREFAEAGYTPTRPIASIDLFKTVKRRFKFPSNKMDYVAHRLLGIRKLDTGGFSLWPAFMEGDEKAIRKMTRYNIRDIVITERLYKFLRPWIVNHPYVGSVDIDFGEESYTCPVCESKNIGKHTSRRTRCFAIRQCRCGGCGHWFDGKRKKLS